MNAETRLDRPCGLGCNRATCGPTVCHGRIPWDELPCREFCNHYGDGTRCFAGAGGGQCGNPYRRDDPRYWLGRGSEDVPGKPFGWAHMMQDIAICQHLRAHGIEPNTLQGFSRRSKLKMRLERDYHRRKPPIGVRRKATAERPPVEDFTREELAHLVELFAGANDPLSVSIAVKAARMLEK